MFAVCLSSYISQKYDVDSGRGNICYVPLIGASRLELIGLPGAASIIKGDSTIMHSVVRLYQKDDIIFGKTFDHSCFTFDGHTLICQRESILVAQRHQGQPIAWQDAAAFYRERRGAIAGNAYMLALVACITVGLIVVWLLKRLVLGKS